MFGLCQIHALVDYLRSKMSQDDFEILFRGLVISVVTISFLLGVILTITGTYNINIFFYLPQILFFCHKNININVAIIMF